MKTTIHLNKLLTTTMIIVSCVVLSCQKVGEKAKEEKTFQLVKQPDKIIELDSLTNYDRVVGRLIDVEGKTNFVYYNQAQTSLYFHDYVTGKVNDIVKLKQEGPNKVPTFVMDFLIHTKDSIFINSRLYTDQLYMVNRHGEVLYKKTSPNNLDDVLAPRDNSKNYTLDNAAYFNYPNLHFGIDIFKPELGEPYPLRGALNLLNNDLHDLYMEKSTLFPNFRAYAELRDSKGGLEINSTTVGNGAHVFASSQISDSIYEYNKGKFIKAHFAGHPKVNLGDYKTLFESAHIVITVVEGGGAMEYIYAAERPPHFGRMLIDLEKEWIYRFLIERTKGEELEGTKSVKVLVDQASIVAFNTNTKKSYTLKFPEEVDLNVNLQQIFANKNGIHFPSSDQETESEKRYNVYKLQ